MADNVSIIREFIDAWSSLDAERLAGYFTDDGTYHNMPAQAVSGRENVEVVDLDTYERVASAEVGKQAGGIVLAPPAGR